MKKPTEEHLFNYNRSILRYLSYNLSTYYWFQKSKTLRSHSVLFKISVDMQETTSEGNVFLEI